MLRRTMLALSVGMLVGALPSTAEATVFELTQVTTTVPQPNPLFMDSFPFRLTISDAAVTRGTFQIAGSGSGNPGEVSYSGDVADFVSLLVVDGSDFITPGYLRGRFELSASFAADRTVSGFSVLYLGNASEASLSATGGDFVSGVFGSDRPDCNSSLSQGRCTVSGRLVEVPEPMSLALLGTGLLGTAAVRRRALAGQPPAGRTGEAFSA